MFLCEYEARAKTDEKEIWMAYRWKRLAVLVVLLFFPGVGFAEDSEGGEISDLIDFSSSLSLLGDDGCKEKTPPDFYLKTRNHEVYPYQFAEEGKGKKWKKTKDTTDDQMQAFLDGLNRRRSHGGAEDSTLCQHTLDGFCQRSTCEEGGNKCVIDVGNVTFSGIEPVNITRGTFKGRCLIKKKVDNKGFCKCPGS